VVKISEGATFEYLPDQCDPNSQAAVFETNQRASNWDWELPLIWWDIVAPRARGFGARCFAMNRSHLHLKLAVGR